jgi:hypothetical protein
MITLLSTVRTRLFGMFPAFQTIKKGLFFCRIPQLGEGVTVGLIQEAKRGYSRFLVMGRYG